LYKRKGTAVTRKPNAGALPGGFKRKDAPSASREGGKSAGEGKLRGASFCGGDNGQGSVVKGGGPDTKPRFEEGRPRKKKKRDGKRKRDGNGPRRRVNIMSNTCQSSSTKKGETGGRLCDGLKKKKKNTVRPREGKRAGGGRQNERRYNLSFSRKLTGQPIKGKFIRAKKLREVGTKT